MVSAALARQAGDHSFPMFRDKDEDIRTGLAGPAEVETENDHRSHVENDFGDLFRTMTNVSDHGDEPPPLEHEESQAKEALELMNAGDNVSESGDKNVGTDVAYDG